jgi:hypothetical protein
MHEREIHRREPGRPPASPSLLRRRSNPMLALQRLIGNRAVAQMLARTPTRTGTVHIGGVGDIKVKGGNLEEWAGTAVLDTVDVTSTKGKHSVKLEKLANAHTKTDIKVTIADASKAGDDLNVGGGILLEIEGARIKGYTVADGIETWQIAVEKVHRTKITHKIGASP